jgi:hypothetical protein|tara:strand:+ start:215 stop:406 length:192 start_codon:yes stop_codon:yes gene_type:complete
MGYTDYEWGKLHKGWQYKEDAPKCAKWQKDRKELFSKHGNGWWWFVGCVKKNTAQVDIHKNGS